MGWWRRRRGVSIGTPNESTGPSFLLVTPSYWHLLFLFVKILLSREVLPPPGAVGERKFGLKSSLERRKFTMPHVSCLQPQPTRTNWMPRCKSQTRPRYREGNGSSKKLSEGSNTGSLQSLTTELFMVLRTEAWLGLA